NPRARQRSPRTDIFSRHHVRLTCTATQPQQTPHPTRTLQRSPSNGQKETPEAPSFRSHQPFLLPEIKPNRQRRAQTTSGYDSERKEEEMNKIPA
ncbi:hypothetical protein ACLOJK_003327, partial [Asimina triloba]